MKRFQNKMAESRWSLTVTSIMCLMVWLLAGSGLVDGSRVTLDGGWFDVVSLNPMAWVRHPMIFTLPCMAVSTYLMVELNNANALIRIYSRMVSCAFLVLTSMATFQFLSVRAAIVTLSIIGFYIAAFRSYQDTQAAGWVFYAFLCVGVASIAFVQVLYFLPLLWLLLGTKLYAFSSRTFVASLLGVALPYWFFITYCVFTDNMVRFASHFVALTEFVPLPFTTEPSTWLPSVNILVTVTYVLTLAIIGSIHYLRTRQNDRIRTQMFYEMFIIVIGATLLFLFLQPTHVEVLLSILVVNTSPLIAHFIALTQTRWTNLLTVIMIILAIAITVFNLLTPIFAL